MQSLSIILINRGRSKEQDLSMHVEEHAITEIKSTCSIHHTEVATQINALLGTLNKIVHHPLSDVLDPTATVCLIINKLTVGEIHAKILECIAVKLNIAFIVIP